MSKQISLTQGQFAIVDDEDYERIAKFKWYCSVENGNRYAKRGQYIAGSYRSVSIGMHHEVLNIKPDKFIVPDHKNRNGLDNRKSNLKLTTRGWNAINTYRKPELKADE
jgi:hypothetical protein